jgi:hypothetical protein
MNRMRIRKIRYWFKISCLASCQMIVMTTLMSHRKVNCSGSKKSRSILEPLLELVLRATKSFESLHSRKAIYKRNSESLSKYCQFSKSRLKKVMRKWQLNFRFCTCKHKDLNCCKAQLTNQNKNRKAEEKRFHNYQCRNRRVVNRIWNQPIYLIFAINSGAFCGF